MKRHLRNPFRFPYKSLAAKNTSFPRKRLLLKAMLTTSFILAVCYVMVAAPVYSFPLKSARVFSLQPQSVDSLTNLVNSPSNKAIYAKLQNSDNAFYDPHQNTVGTLDFATANQYQRQPYVANGYIGARIPNLGQGFAYDQLSSGPDATNDDLSNGWPLFNKRYAGAFVAGFYNIQKNTTETNFDWLLEYGYESVIAAVPQWTTLRVTHGSNVLDPDLPAEWGSISNYVQNMSLADGIVSTRFTWNDTLEIQYDVLAHRDNVNLAIVDLKIHNSAVAPAEVTVEDILDFDTAQRAQLNATGFETGQGIYILYQPNEIDYVFGATYSTLSYLGQCVEEVFGDSARRSSQGVTFSIPPDSDIHVTKYVGIVTSDLDPAAYNSFQSVLDKARLVACASSDLNALVAAHKDAWAETLGLSLSISFPDDPLLTLAARASVFHLSANTRPFANGVTAAMGVTGLSADSYAGMVFWDTDLWMLNGLLPFNPLHARSMINYRLHTHEQALRNLDFPQVPKQGLQGAAYPWTSGRFGNCTATGPCFDYEYHINVAVAISAWELYMSGAANDDFLETVAYPLINDAALFLASYVDYNETYGKYTTKNLTDPDEYANHVDNGAYTNAAISATLRWAGVVASHLGKSTPESIAKVANNIYMPTSPDDSDIVLEYSGMNSSVGIKQADVIMITYPLENELISKEQAMSNMDFYSAKQVNFGPAMTFPIFSIVASALLETGCSSQSYLQKAVQPFLRGPFAQFLEQNNDNFLTNGGTHPAFPFMTAHGGFLQAIVQGLLGLRFDHRVEQGKIVRVLKLDPAKLPNLPAGVSFEGIQYLNHTLSFNLTGSELVVKNNGPVNAGSELLEINISLGSRNPHSATYTLAAGDTLTLPLYETSTTFTNTLTECGRSIFTNITDGAYGDATVLVNDGDNTTHWQSQTSTGKILVDLKSVTKLTRGFVIWGERPPTLLTIYAAGLDLETQYPALNSTIDFLSHVDFGNDLYQKYRFNNPTGTVYTQADIFSSIYSTNVDISAPYKPEDLPLIVLPTRHNTTIFDFPADLHSRYILLEFDGTHDDSGMAGAKVYEVSLF